MTSYNFLTVCPRPLCHALSQFLNPLSSAPPKKWRHLWTALKREASIARNSLLHFSYCFPDILCSVFYKTPFHHLFLHHSVLAALALRNPNTFSRNFFFSISIERLSSSSSRSSVKIQQSTTVQFCALFFTYKRGLSKTTFAFFLIFWPPPLPLVCIFSK